MFIASIPVVILLMLDRCSGWGILSLKLVNYRNPDSTLFNGECCDTLAWCSSNDCENYFKFCVTSLGSLRTCNLGSSTTRVLGDDDFSFPGVGQILGTNLINPLSYNFSYWQGSTVVVEVWDDDGGQIVGALHDFVDKYTLTLSQLQSADPDHKSSTPKTKKLCGKRSCMTVTVTLCCGPNYLVPDCRTYCVSRNDSLGHYHCNYTVGRKVCNEGWYDPLTDCVKKRKFCSPRNDSLGHYDCDPASGEKLCLAGWTGDNCTQVCLFSPCHSNVLKSTSKLVPEISSLNFVALTTTVIPTTVTHLDTGVSSTKNNYLSSNDFTTKQSTVLHYVTSSPSSSVSRISSATEGYSLPHNTILLVSQSYQTPKLQSLVSTKKPPSSSSLTSSSSSSTMLSLSSFPTTFRFQTSAHVSLLFLTTSVTRLVEKTSVVPSPTPVRPTDGLEIELKPYHKWTPGREEQVGTELVNKLNEFCAKHPLPCLMTPNMTVNRTAFSMSHVIMKITNSSDGKIWVRVKVKLPATVPHVPGVGYLPAVALKRIVMENKDRLEKSLEAEIVTVKEVAWDLPTVPPEQSTLMMNTDLPTTLREYYAGFLPYVLVALCLTAAFIVGFAFYRRSKLREARVLPEPESNKSEEELITLSSRKSSTNTRPRSAPDDTKRTGYHQSDLISFHENPDASRRNKYRFRSESGLRELIESDSRSSEDEDTKNSSRGNDLFLTKSRLRELTQVST